MYSMYISIHSYVAQADFTNKYALANAHQGQIINDVIMHWVRTSCTYAFLLHFNVSFRTSATHGSHSWCFHIHALHSLKARHPSTTIYIIFTKSSTVSCRRQCEEMSLSITYNAAASDFIEHLLKIVDTNLETWGVCIIDKPTLYVPMKLICNQQLCKNMTFTIILQSETG